MDYQEVARRASEWTRDDGLSPRLREAASQLADLSSILADSYYGCPTEAGAAQEMYAILSRAVSRERPQ